MRPRWQAWPVMVLQFLAGSDTGDNGAILPVQAGSEVLVVVR